MGAPPYGGTYVNQVSFDPDTYGETHSRNGFEFSLVASVFSAGNWCFKGTPSEQGDAAVNLGTITTTGTQILNGTAVTDSYVSTKLRVHTFPTAGHFFLFDFFTNGGADAKGLVGVTSARQVRFYDKNLNVVSTLGTLLTADTNYRVEAYCGTGTTGAWEVRLYTEDGTTLIDSMSGTADVRATGTDRLVVGWLPSATETGAGEFYIRDIVWKNGDWCGAGIVRFAVARGDSATNTGFAASGAATKWQCVNEIPNDGDTSVIFSSTNGATYSALMQSAATIGLVNDPSAVRILAATKNQGGGAMAFANGVRSGGSNSFTSDATATAAYSPFLSRMMSVDPTDAANWTIAKFDALEAAVQLNNTNATWVSGLYLTAHDVAPLGPTRRRGASILCG